jgi:uncharacterized protein
MALMPPRTERLAIEGPVGALEALIEQPPGAPVPASAAPAAPQAFAVVCHPHPLHGGTLDNKVVYTVARACLALGVPAIRFNFRGVGASAGHYDEGRGEAEDARAVIAWGRRRWPGAALWLGGFSFGGAIAIRIAGLEHPTRLVAVAPGITLLDVAGAPAPACPWLIVQGDSDDVVPPQAVRAWVQRLVPAAGVSVPRLAMLPGTGHFFHGRINELREVVLEFLR